MVECIRSSGPRRNAIVVAVLLCSLLGLPPSALGLSGTDDAATDDPVAVLEAFFGDPGGHRPACARLELFYDRRVRAGVPRETRVQVMQWRRQFADKAEEIDRLRADLDATARSTLLAGFDLLRKIEVARLRVGAATSGEFQWDEVWRVADAIFALPEAEARVVRETLAYYVGLWNLTSAEGRLREFARDYYGFYAGVFGVLPAPERERVLAALRERTRCIARRREEVFARQIDDATVFRDAMGAWQRGGVGTGGEDVGGTDSGVFTRGVSSLARSLASSIQLEREYAWLAAETPVATGVLSSLLAAHDRAFVARELHEARLRDIRVRPDIGPHDLLPGTTGDAIRLRVLQARAERGAMAMEDKRLAAEAAYRLQVSTALGLGKLFSDVWRQLGVTAEGLVDNPRLEGGELSVQAAAVFAIGHKLLAETAQLLLARPLQEAFTAYALGPVSGLLGTDVKTLAERERDRYRQTKTELDRRAAFLREVRSATTMESARAFIAAVRSGHPGAGGIGQQAPMTVRELFEDADFIARTDGGLPWIFAIAARDPGDRNALLAWGARYELEANNRLAAVRVAATRGLSVENPDITLTRGSLEAILDPQGQPPESFADFAALAADRVITLTPGLGALRELWRLPQTVRNGIEYLKGNIEDQNDYLRTRVEMQQQVLDVINALDVCDYRPACLEDEWPELHRDHVDLLSRSSEWVNAVRRMRHLRLEREKTIAWARHVVDGKVPTPRGRARAAELQKRQDRSDADLLQRAAHLRLVDHALTANYGAAALQVTALEKAAERRRRAFGIEPETVDLSGVREAFEAEVVRNELVTVYEGLYQGALTSVVLGLTQEALVDGTMSGVTAATGLRFDLPVDPAAPRTQFLSQLNPWVDKFSASGVYNTFEGAFEAAVDDAATQLIAQSQGIFTEQQLAGVVGGLLTVVRGVEGDIRKRLDKGDVTWTIDRLEHEARQRVIDQYVGELADHARRVRQLEGELGSIDSGPDGDADRSRIVDRILELAGDDAMRFRRASLARVMEDVDEVIERRVRADEESRLFARRVTTGILEIDARRRQGSAQRGSTREDAAALQAARAALLGRMSGDEVDVRDLERLVDADDRLGLRSGLLTEGLDIGVIRHALKTAEERNPGSAERIRQIAREVDSVRIAVVDQLLARFMEQHGSDVVVVIQGGAAEGNPEYQGVLGDIDFTVFTHEDVDGDRLKRQLLDLFAEAGYPLAEDTSAGAVPGTMDTEAFVQPWGSFDSGSESFVDVLYDIALKRNDPTRFYSEAGGKWFLNNVAYSGKILAGDDAQVSGWTRIEPGEAYGLALDMARYLGYLTDGDYAPAALRGLSDTEARKAKLTSVLKKTKYFIRLVDAYLISHEGLGNELYNEVRLGRRPSGRAPAGDDASYHLQIYKDAEALVRATADADPDRASRAGQEVLAPEDLPFVRWMAEMKMKGVNPDPWEVIEGDSDEEKVANAIALTEWMRSKGPQILAETGEVWMSSFQRTMTEGTAGERQLARADARRIGTIVRNVDEKDPYGAASLMRPPVVLEEGEEGAPRYRIVDATTHREQIEGDMHAAQEIRERQKRRIDRAAAAIREEYPPEKYLDEAQREALAERIREMTREVFDREEPVLEQEEEVLEWVRFWLTR